MLRKAALAGASCLATTAKIYFLPQTGETMFNALSSPISVHDFDRRVWQAPSSLSLRSWRGHSRLLPFLEAVLCLSCTR